VLEQSKQLIRNMAMFNDSLPKLPEKRKIVIKLKYHADTPVDYEPDHFRATCADSYSKFAARPKRVTLGDLNTSYHSMSLTFTGANWLFEEEESDDDFEEEREGSIDFDETKDAKGDLNGEEDAQLREGYEDIDDDMAVTQPTQAVVRLQSPVAPACTPATPSSPITRRRSARRPAIKSHSEPALDDLEQRFGRLDAVAASSSRLDPPAPPRSSHPAPESKVHQDEEDIDDFDDDDDKTRLDECEDDDSSGGGGMAPSLSAAEAAILDYLVGKKSAGVGIISLITRIDELTVSALLHKMAKRDLVESTRGDRWKSLEGTNETYDMDSVYSDYTQAAALMDPPKPPRSSARSKASAPVETPLQSLRALPMAPPPLPPKASKKADAEAPVIRKSKRSLPVKEDPPLENDVPGDMALEESSTMHGSGYNDTRDDDGDEYSDPYGLGGIDLSQYSTSSQSGSKYSLVTTPLRQSRKSKRSKTGGC